MASSPNQTPEVTVITLTRGRPELLRRAIASVAAQDLTSKSHLVLVDDCEPTRAFLARADLHYPNLEWIVMPRAALASQALGPLANGAWPAGRCAFMRNAGIRYTASPWISFLDDDNTFEPNHLSSLVKCARLAGARAAHSWMQIFDKDGNPYLEPRHPWTHDPDESRRVFRDMVSQRILEVGSNIVRHRAYAEGSENFIPAVDTSEWLFQRDLLLEVPVPEEYTEDDCRRLCGEDDKLLDELLARKELIVCSNAATLRYYLGGYSNEIA